MNYFKLNEKMLKHNLKNRRRITLSLIVAYLITGEIGAFLDYEIFARDLRPRNKNTINIDQKNNNNNLHTTTSENGKDVVNIGKLNNNGISHNKFIDLSVGTDGIIFNNNATNSGYNSTTGGIVSYNPNLVGGNAAKTILNEVTGSQTAINGAVEIAGTKADFVVANENGITVNGGNFINASSVTLSTGKPTVNGSNVDLTVTKGNVTIEGNGVGTSGNYFNIISQTINLQGQIAKTNYEGNQDANITLLAGQNKATVNQGGKMSSYEKIGDEKSTLNPKYGITATNLGSMYGNNIRLISTTEGVGVRHEGIISSKDSITINSSGDIEVGHVVADKKIDAKAGGSFTTLSGTHKSGDKDEKNTLGAETIKIDAGKSVNLKTDVQAKNEVAIKGKDIVNEGYLKAGDESKKVGKVTIEGTNITNKNLIVSGNDLAISAGDLKNNEGAKIASNKLKLTTTKDLLNSGKISGDDIDIKAEDVTNSLGAIIGEDLEIIAKNLKNDRGELSGIKKVKATVEDTILNQGIINSDGQIDLVAKIINNEKAITAKNKINITASEKFVSNVVEDINKILDYQEHMSYSYGKVVKKEKEINELEEKLENPNLSEKERKDIEEKLEVAKAEWNKLLKDREVLFACKLSNVSSDEININAGTVDMDGIFGGKNSIDIKADTTTLKAGISNSITVEGKTLTIEGERVNGNIKADLEELLEVKMGRIDSLVGEAQEINIDNSDFSNLEIEGQVIELDRVGSNGNITINENKKYNNSDVVFKKSVTGKNVIVNSDKLDNQSDFSGDNLRIDAVNITNSNKIGSVLNTTIKSNEIINDGRITSNDKVTIEAMNIINNKQIDSTREMEITAKNITNEGVLSTTAGNFAINLLDNGKIINSTADSVIVGGSKLNIRGENVTIDNVGSIATKHGDLYITGEGIVLYNDGVLSAGSDGPGSLIISIKSLFNNNQIGAYENVDIIVKDYLQREQEALLDGKNINLTADRIELAGKIGNLNNFTDGGTHSTESVNINAGSKGIVLDNVSITAKIDDKQNSNRKLTTIKSEGNVLLKNKNKVFSGLTLEAKGDITNQGMLATNEGLLIIAKNLINEISSTIYAGGNATFKIAEKLWNKLRATISAEYNMDITADTLTNDAGTIKSGKNMTLNVNTLENRSVVEGEGYKVTGEKYIGKEEGHSWKAAVDMYHRVEIWLPEIEVDLRVKDKASISSGGGLIINGKDGTTSKTNVTNTSGLISGSRDVKIYGDLRNETGYKTMTVEKYLSLIKVKLTWETRLLLTGAYGNSGVNYEGSLLDALTYDKDRFGDSNCKGYTTALKTLASKNPELKKLLNAAFGADWTTKDIVPLNKLDLTNKYYFYATNGNAQILAGGSFIHSGGKLENLGGETNSGKKIDVTIGGETVEGVVVDLDVNIKNPNDITETEEIKVTYPQEIQTGKVPIVIKDEYGNDVVVILDSTVGVGGAISTAGTINSLIYIDIPKGPNEAFNKKEPDPNKTINQLFGDNIGFMPQDDYINSNKFFEDVGYDPNKPTTVIGDSAYQKQLLEKTLQQGLNYSGQLSYKDMNSLLENAKEVGKELGLEIGKPLTADQINKLDKDIIWYVEMEMEVDGKKQTVLVPQIYFSKQSRADIMYTSKYDVETGSTIKAGGTVEIDADNVVNSTGNITGGAATIVMSKGDIINNSNANVAGGIQSTGAKVDAYDKDGNPIYERDENGDFKLDESGNKIQAKVWADGHTALNAKNDIIMKGGNVKGDVVLVDAGNNIDIVSGVTSNKDGDQAIENAAGIIAGTGMVINAGNDFNMTGGVLQSNGHHVEPPKSEEEKPEIDSQTNETNSQGKSNKETGEKEKQEEQVTEKQEEQVTEKQEEQVKDMNYYKDLLYGKTPDKKLAPNDANKILEEFGAQAGEVKITAGGNVNIKDLNLVSYKETEYDNQKDIDLANKINKEIEKINQEIRKRNEQKYKEAQEKAAKGEIPWSEVIFTEKYFEKELPKVNVPTLAKGTVKQTVSSSVGSVVVGEKITIDSKKNVTVQGSNLVVSSNDKKEGSLSENAGINIKAGENIDIVDGRDLEHIEDEMNKNEIKYGIIPTSSHEKLTIDGSYSKGSQIVSNGNINLEAGKDIKVVGSTISSAGNTEIEAEGDVKFEAGRNDVKQHYEKSESGIISTDAGFGLSGNYGENFSKSVGQNGKLMGDTFGSAQVTIGTTSTTQDTTAQTWTESKLSGSNITIKSGKKVDIGGVNMEAYATEGEDGKYIGGNISVEGEEILTTKYVDKVETETSQNSSGVKIWNTETSTIAGWINLGKEWEERSKTTIGMDTEANALNAAQGITQGVNTVLQDTVASSSGISFVSTTTKSKETVEQENTTTIKGNNISFKSTKGDIKLKGVDIVAGIETDKKVLDEDGKPVKDDYGNDIYEWTTDGSISLDSAGEIELSAAKTKVKSHTEIHSSEVGINGYAGAGPTGAGVSIGISSNTNHDIITGNGLFHQNTTIKGGNISIKSKGDTNLKGAEVNGTDVDLDIGGSLNVETVKDQYKEDKVNIHEGFNVNIGLGVGTDTLPVGVGVSAGGGKIWENGEQINGQSGITASGSLTGKIDGDMNLTGGVVGSTSGEGGLTLGGNINISDVVAKEQTGGGIGGGTAGFGIGKGANLGAYGTVGDVLDKDTIAKATIGVAVSKPDGTAVELPDGVNTDMSDTIKEVINKKMIGGNIGVGGPASKGSAKGALGGLKNTGKLIGTIGKKAGNAIGSLAGKSQAGKKVTPLRDADVVLNDYVNQMLNSKSKKLIDKDLFNEAAGKVHGNRFQDIGYGGVLSPGMSKKLLNQTGKQSHTFVTDLGDGIIRIDSLSAVKGKDGTTIHIADQRFTYDTKNKKIVGDGSVSVYDDQIFDIPKRPNHSTPPSIKGHINKGPIKIGNSGGYLDDQLNGMDIQDPVGTDIPIIDNKNDFTDALNKNQNVTPPKAKPSKKSEQNSTKQEVGDVTIVEKKIMN